MLITQFQSTNIPDLIRSSSLVKLAEVKAFLEVSLENAQEIKPRTLSTRMEIKTYRYWIYVIQLRIKELNKQKDNKNLKSSLRQLKNQKQLARNSSKLLLKVLHDQAKILVKNQTVVDKTPTLTIEDSPANSDVAIFRDHLRIKMDLGLSLSDALIELKNEHKESFNKSGDELLNVLDNNSNKAQSVDTQALELWDALQQQYPESITPDTIMDKEEKEN